MREGERVAGRFLLKKRMTGGNRTRTDVWLAYDERMERDVVLKRDRLEAQPAGGQVPVEPRAMAKFNQPHVVSVFEVVSLDEDDWFVLEYAPAGSLAGVPRLPPARAAAIGAQVASALVALHAKGIVHCDVKPGNIVIAENGAAKLTDFGAAYRIGSPRAPISYTAAYAAPEVLAGTPNPKSDVYSLAITLQELTTAAGPLREVLAAMSQPDPAARPDAATVRRLLESPSRRRFPVALGAAAVAVLLTAADVPAGPRVFSLIGDARTADPCAMVDVDLFRQFGEAYLEPDYGNFERCDVIVEQAGDVDIEVSFDPRPPPEQAPTTKVGRIHIAELPEEELKCVRVLALPDDRATVRVTVDGDEPAPMCEMADIAAKFAAERLDAGTLPRRDPPLPDDSLVWEDACGLVDAAALSVVPGVDAAHPEVWFGTWDCTWGSTTGDLYLSLSFGRGSPPTAADGQLTRIAGQQAVIMPESDGEQTCAVLVEHREYSDTDGDPAVEMLRVDIAREGPPTSQLCAQIAKVAESATNALRSTSG